MDRIILIGFMASGKSTLGKELAAKLHIPFLDSDELIEKQDGRSINDIFKEEGESFFRQLESEVIAKLDRNQRFVLSVGGGLPVIEGMMDRLQMLGTTVYLSVSEEELVRRLMKDRSARPLLKDKNEQELKEFVQQLRISRIPVYESAQIVLRNDFACLEDLITALSLHQRN